MPLGDKKAKSTELKHCLEVDTFPFNRRGLWMFVCDLQLLSHWVCSMFQCHLPNDAYHDHLIFIHLYSKMSSKAKLPLFYYVIIIFGVTSGQEFL